MANIDVPKAKRGPRKSPVEKVVFYRRVTKEQYVALFETLERTSGAAVQENPELVELRARVVDLKGQITKLLEAAAKAPVLPPPMVDSDCTWTIAENARLKKELNAANKELSSYRMGA